MNNKPIYVSRNDHTRLTRLLDELRVSGVKSRGADNLRVELNRARVVDPSTVSDDLVILGSRVRIRDLDTSETEEYTVTLPQDSDPGRNRISILSPIGTGLLGFSVGDEVTWETPGGARRLKIEAVDHNPPEKKVVPPYFPADLLGVRPSA